MDIWELTMDAAITDYPETKCHHLSSTATSDCPTITSTSMPTATTITSIATVTVTTGITDPITTILTTTIPTTRKNDTSVWLIYKVH